MLDICQYMHSWDVKVCQILFLRHLIIWIRSCHFPAHWWLNSLSRSPQLNTFPNYGHVVMNGYNLFCLILKSEPFGKGKVHHYFGKFVKRWALILFVDKKNSDRKALHFFAHKKSAWCFVTVAVMKGGNGLAYLFFFFAFSFILPTQMP